MHCPVPRLHTAPEPHVLHVAPPLPHKEFDSDAYGTQVEPLQQPVARGRVADTLPGDGIAFLPEAQAAQAAPPVPQELFDSDA